MLPEKLKQDLLSHAETFRCSRIHDRSQTKLVAFRHEITAAAGLAGVPEIGRMKEFYRNFGSITFYRDEVSGDSARYIAPVSEWQALRDAFDAWVEVLTDDEANDAIPGGLRTCIVVGEEPHSGNYILVPTQGSAAGAVYHFDHDGFEFRRFADDLFQYCEDLLDLDDRGLTYIATHMRFIEGDAMVQWWIEELNDNRGNIARTAA